MSKLTLFGAVLLASVLVGCGGGGSDSSMNQTETKPPKTEPVTYDTVIHGRIYDDYDDFTAASDFIDCTGLTCSLRTLNAPVNIDSFFRNE